MTVTAIKLKLKLTPSGDIDFNDVALVIFTYVQVRGSIEGVDSDLRAALFRLSAALDDRVIAHRASAVATGGGTYVPPTAAEYDASMVDLGTAVSDAAVDLDTAVTSMYAPTQAQEIGRFGSRHGAAESQRKTGHALQH